MITGAEAIIVAAVTLALIVARPRGLNEGLAALLGAAATLLLGLVPLAQAVHLEAANWNIFLFFLGMMTVAALADQSGVFDTVAFRVTRLAGGRVPALYACLFALGALISVLFANDTTALVLTPIVYTLVTRLSLDPLPFVFATTFVADTASVVLPVSNPLNVILADGFHLSLGSYLAHLWLPALLVLLVNAAAFALLFRHGIRGRYRPLPVPAGRRGLASTFALLGVLALAYLLASAAQFPLGVVATVGALALLGNLQRSGELDLRRLGRELSYPIFLFIAGMNLVVQSLHNSGVTGELGRALVRVGSGSPLAAITAGVVGSALGSNVINNLPMALVMVSTVGALHVTAATRDALVYSTVLGCDLGPNLTHLGSLATFIWLFFLRRKGLEVSAWDYFRIGVVVTPLLLAAAITGLWVTTGNG